MPATRSRSLPVQPTLAEDYFTRATFIPPLLSLNPSRIRPHQKPETISLPDAERVVLSSVAASCLRYNSTISSICPSDTQDSQSPYFPLLYLVDTIYRGSFVLPLFKPFFRSPP